MLLWLVFGVSGIVPKVLKMLAFPRFWGGFCEVAYSCLFGFGRFRCCCVFLVFVFLLCVAFVFVLFALFLFCCWIVIGVGSCFVLFLLGFCVFVFFSFSFLEGLRVR